MSLFALLCSSRAPGAMWVPLCSQKQWDNPCPKAFSISIAKVQGLGWCVLLMLNPWFPGGITGWSSWASPCPSLPSWLTGPGGLGAHSNASYLPTRLLRSLTNQALQSAALSPQANDSWLTQCVKWLQKYTNQTTSSFIYLQNGFSTVRSGSLLTKGFGFAFLSQTFWTQFMS